MGAWPSPTGHLPLSSRDRPVLAEMEPTHDVFHLEPPDRTLLLFPRLRSRGVSAPGFQPAFLIESGETEVLLRWPEKKLRKSPLRCSGPGQVGIPGSLSESVVTTIVPAAAGASTKIATRAKAICSFRRSSDSSRKRN